MYFTTLFGYIGYIENYSQYKKMPVRIQEIIFIWYIGILFTASWKETALRSRQGKGMGMVLV